MISWLVDHTTLVYVLLIGAGLGFLAAWWMTRRRQHVVVLAALAGAGGLVFLLSILVDTDRKKIWRALQEMAIGVQQRDLKRSFAQVAENCKTEFYQKGALAILTKKDLHELASEANKRGGVKEILLWDPEFEEVEPPHASLYFKAKPFGRWTVGAEFCVCRAEFHLETDGQWRMTSLKLYHPFRSKELLDLPD
jgi:hypothetical protein